MQKKYSKWFTLVELIVVITILAVLWTLWFLSFSNYAATTRDSTRVTNMRSLEKQLNIAFAKSSRYVHPDNSVEIRSDTEVIQYQWELWTNGLTQIDIGDIQSWKDPLNNTFYTYTTNQTYTQYQLGTYLEQTAYVPMLTTYAGYLENATITTIGKPLWIILKSNGIPVNEDSTIQGVWYVDIKNPTETYTITFNTEENITSGSGNTLLSALAFFNEDISGLDESLVLHYNMEDTITVNSIDHLKDLSGYGNHGKCYESSVQVNCGSTSWPQKRNMWGIGGVWMSFDGVDDSLLISWNSEVNANTRTIVIRSRKTGSNSVRLMNQYFWWAVPGNFTIYSHDSSTSFESYFRSLPADDRFKACSRTSVMGSFYNLAYVQVRATSSGSLIQGYYNGEKFCERNDYSSDMSGYPWWNSWGIYVAVRDLWASTYTYMPPTFYAGDIDEIRIYNRVLSADEIALLNESQSAN